LGKGAVSRWRSRLTKSVRESWDGDGEKKKKEGHKKKKKKLTPGLESEAGAPKKKE